MTRERRTSRRRNRWKDVAVGLLATVLLFAVAEMFLRWQVGRGGFSVRQALQQALKKNPLVDEWEVPDPRMGFRPKSNFIHDGVQVINSLGFRGSEFSPQKSRGVFRVVALGDSVTFGLFADAMCNWPSQLQRRLDAIAPGRYEVINGAVEGYGTWHVLQRLRYDVLPLRPDMVIVLVGWNDLWVYDPDKQEIASDPTAPQRFKDHWFNRVVLKSYVMKWLAKQVLTIGRFGDESAESKLGRFKTFVPSGSMANYRQIVRVAKAAGIPWVVLGTQPSVAGSDNIQKYVHVMHFPTFAKTPELFSVLWERYSASIRQVAEEEGAVLVDMAEVIKKEVPDSGRYFFDSAHMDCAGYEILGPKVFDQLERIGAWRQAAKR